MHFEQCQKALVNLVLWEVYTWLLRINRDGK